LKVEGIGVEGYWKKAWQRMTEATTATESAKRPTAMACLVRRMETLPK